MDIPIEKRFKVLCEIVRAQHFAWREAALAMAPGLDPKALGGMWQRHLRGGEDYSPQIWSVMMFESFLRNSA